MKYFQEGDILLSDFDGVFFDSQQRFDQIMKDEKSPILWKKFLDSIIWEEFLKECEEIPEATNTYKKLIELNIFKGFLLSIASFEEGYAKAKIIRGRGLYVPIYYVLAPQKKSLIYPPNKHVVLLEDKIQNAEDWEDNGGKAILINCKTTQKNRTYIKNFSDLLKK